MRQMLVTLAVAVVVTGCAGGGQPPTATPELIPQTTSPQPVASIPLCDDVPNLSAPADWYRDTPIYVGNEMEDLIEPIERWAGRQPGYAGIWIDRQHHGWVSVAFTVDAELRQAELREAFPEDGVVAIPVEWTEGELRAVQSRVTDFLRAHDIPGGSGGYISKGVTSIEMGVRRPEWVALAEQLFAGQPVCISGLDPEDAPPDGPQQPSGNGWRLLGHAESAGPGYRTGIAYDADSYARLWTESEISDPQPEVDFMDDVVIWFSAVTGSSCPDLRLDDVIVDSERSLVYADIVNTGGDVACTSDIYPHSFVVTLARELLPTGGFSIQLNEAGPPAGAPEERTVVDADLTQPGSTADPDHIGEDPDLPEPEYLSPGGFAYPGMTWAYEQPAECGLEWLGPLNDVSWRTEAVDGTAGWVPPEWQSEITEDETIVLEVLIETGDVPTLTATTNNHSVIYYANIAAVPSCN
jgi:hypothetical protein